MEEVTNVFFYLFFIVLFGLYSLLSSDPLNSSVGLLMSVVLSACYYSPLTPFYLSYLLVLLMLSGVLVVVVTVTSLSKFTTGYRSGGILFLVSTFSFPSYVVSSQASDSLSDFNTLDYLWGYLLLVFILFLLLLFMNIMISSSGGALRKL